jgi:hypothetical protein
MVHSFTVKDKDLLRDREEGEEGVSEEMWILEEERYE